MLAQAHDDPLLRMHKRQARQHGLQRRSALPDGLNILLSALAINRLRSLPEYEQARVVFGFASFGTELRTESLFESVWQDGKVLGLPVTIASERRLEFRRVERGDSLRAGMWSIPEPLASRPVIAPQSAQLVVVPGVVFDAAGHRVGYGGGYYDRLLQLMLQEGQSDAMAFFGLAFEVQVYERVPVGRGDKALDGLVTDASVRRFVRARDS